MGTQDIVQRMTDAYLEQGGALKGIDHDLAVKVYRQFAADASDGMVAYPNVARMMGVSGTEGDIKAWTTMLRMELDLRASGRAKP
jgi:hypothetical protein